MAWTAPRTWITGETLTSTLLNTHLRDNLLYIKGGAFPLFDSVFSGTTLPAASISVSSLDQTFAHLLVVVYSREDTVTTLDGVNVRFNADSAANYDYQYERVAATSVTGAETFAATAIQAGLHPGASGAANLFGTTEILISNYTGANNKEINARSSVKIGTTTGQMTHQTSAGFWRSNAAINQITVLPATGNLIAGSRVSIYGLGTPS